MAYNNYSNRGSYNNYGNRGGYQQNNYGGNNNYQQQQQPAPEPPMTIEEFFTKRIDTYLAATELIKARGLDPAEFSLYLGPWVTSFLLENKRSNKI